VISARVFRDNCPVSVSLQFGKRTDRVTLPPWVNVTLTVTRKLRSNPPTRRFEIRESSANSWVSKVRFAMRPDASEVVVTVWDYITRPLVLSNRRTIENMR
jgi:hypothetical protein